MLCLRIIELLTRHKSFLRCDCSYRIDSWRLLIIPNFLFLIITIIIVFIVVLITLFLSPTCLSTKHEVSVTGKVLNLVLDRFHVRLLCCVVSGRIFSG